MNKVPKLDKSQGSSRWLNKRPFYDWDVKDHLKIEKFFVSENFDSKSKIGNKYWGGLGSIPIILCTDNYYINKNKYFFWSPLNQM